MRLLGFLALLGLSFGALAKDEPVITEKKFPAPPINLFYFDDSETVLVLDPEHQTVYRSEDAGGEWKQLTELGSGEVGYLLPSAHDSSVAIAMGIKLKHWITYDRGKTWKSFETPERPTQDIGKEPFGFHATDNKRILFHGVEECLFGDACVGKTYYTKSGFSDGDLSIVHGRRKTCIWAKSHALFQTGSKSTDDSRILCIVEGKYSPLMKDYKLVVSDDYFKTEKEPAMQGGREMRGFINIAPVKGFIVAAAKSFGSRELGLYVTSNGAQWHRAEIGDHRVEEDAYTILESTNYSIQVDVMTQRFSYIGTLFTSNSNGTYFTKNVEHTNRNRQGIVDFEKIHSIQGIVLVNQVQNWEEVDQPFSFAPKEIKTKISFDDGRSWEPLKVGNEELHVHSVTEQHNSGRVFSSAAPGIIMGIGNTGKFLGTYDAGNLYVSDDAGRTWRATDLKGPQKYEFLDQGSVLVAVAEKEIDEVSFSIDHGRNWKTAALPMKGVRPHELTTIPDATSLKALLIATKGDDYYTFRLDFDGLHESKCGENDFEKWYARYDDDGKPSCVMGHKQYFKRRKWDAKCFVKELTREFTAEKEPCDCTDADFECDTNYKRTASGKCELAGKMLVPDGQCKSREDKFSASSGYRLIPGDDCKRTSGAQKDDTVEKPCGDAIGSPASGKVDVTFTDFRGQEFLQTYYLERDPNASGDDETIVMLTDQSRAYITHDHGKTWDFVRKEDIVSIYPHQYNNDYVYFITPSKQVFYSKDRGKTIHAFEAPDVPDRERQVLGFHQHDPDWLLWIGDKDCKGDRNDPLCHTAAHVSQKGGEEWRTLLSYIEKCQFMYREGRKQSEELIYCSQYEAENKNKPLQLLSSADLFVHKEVIFNDVVNFATMSEFIVVAAKTEDRKWLKVDTSIDAKTFAPAEFPPNFQVQHQQAYTVLDSSTNSIFLHVTINGQRGREYGAILKSNSNGTSYVLSVRHINRNEMGYVDFEKMQGLEGVALVNQVANADAVDSGSPKMLKTLITHNDGADWAPLQRPKAQLDGKPWDCENQGVDKCSLHLHGYTERKDPRDTFSSPSAVGLMLGVGNVGEKLGAYNEGDTFITRDGGITWDAAVPGTYMWEYGDQGSIIVLVQRDTPTKQVLYSLDEGKKWEKYEWGDTLMMVDRITTVPSDNSLKFLLWGHVDRKLVTASLDFSGLFEKQCKLDKDKLDTEESDYYLWYPQHPLKKEEPECLFGHKATYYRKKADRRCFNGPLIDKLHDIERNCTCTRDDFECDYNFERQPDGSCRLVEGLSPTDPMAVCKNDKNAFEYWDITGYRKIAISTCSGGKEMEHTGSAHPCPGHEEEYERKRGLSGIGLFFAIVVPIGAAAAFGYYVWKNFGAKFGAIRLGDTPTLTAGNFTETPWVQWPVAAVSGAVALIAALPLLFGAAARGVRGLFGGYSGQRYTSRESFARGRGTYDAVERDEDELLGDESDEDV